MAVKYAKQGCLLALTHPCLCDMGILHRPPPALFQAEKTGTLGLGSEASTIFHFQTTMQQLKDPRLSSTSDCCNMLVLFADAPCTVNSQALVQTQPDDLA